MTAAYFVLKVPLNPNQLSV